ALGGGLRVVNATAVHRSRLFVWNRFSEDDTWRRAASTKSYLSAIWAWTRRPVTPLVVRQSPVFGWPHRTVGVTSRPAKCRNAPNGTASCFLPDWPRSRANTCARGARFTSKAACRRENGRARTAR